MMTQRYFSLLPVGCLQNAHKHCFKPRLNTGGKESEDCTFVTLITPQREIYVILNVLVIVMALYMDNSKLMA